MTSYKLHIDCPDCHAEDSMRIAIMDDDGATILCLKCEASTEIDIGFLASILSAITQKADEGEVDANWIEGLINERIEEL